MKKEFCDICGKEVDGFWGGSMYHTEKNIDPTVPGKREITSFDLCPEHSRMVYNYINALSETRKEGGE